MIMIRRKTKEKIHNQTQHSIFRSWRSLVNLENQRRTTEIAILIQFSFGYNDAHIICTNGTVC